MRQITRIAVLLLTAGLMAGCETDGGPPSPLAELAAYHARNEVPRGKPLEAEKPPMTRARAAMECWSQAEKTRASASLDARADFVTGCIDGKLKTAQAKPNP